MPAQLTYGTAGATGGGFAGYKGLHPLFREERGDTRPDWSWQRRSLKTWRDRNRWSSCWSWGCRMSAETADLAVGGMWLNHGYEPFSCDGAGTQSSRFIRGITKDSGGTPISGVIVQGFVTSTDAYVGEVQSMDDGSYILPTFTLPGVQHYLVGYKPGAPDIGGTTVNTITSTNVDGT